MTFLKAEQLATAKWRVLAIPFGGEFKGGKDKDGEFFSPRTDVKPHWFKDHPVIFQHGRDPALGDEDIGVEGELIKSNEGWWASIWLDRQNRYFAQIDSMIRAGKAYGSSGAVAHLVKTDGRTGEILVWPHAEQTITTIPINRLSRIAASKAVDDFTTAGIELEPAMRGLLTEDVSNLGPDLPTGGDDPAMARLASTLDQLEEALSLLRSPR